MVRVVLRDGETDVVVVLVVLPDGFVVVVVVLLDCAQAMANRNTAAIRIPSSRLIVIL